LCSHKNCRLTFRVDESVAPAKLQVVKRPNYRLAVQRRQSVAPAELKLLRSDQIVASQFRGTDMSLLLSLNSEATKLSSGSSEATKMSRRLSFKKAASPHFKLVPVYCATISFFPLTRVGRTRTFP
jgi:hypothetical protein